MKRRQKPPPSMVKCQNCNQMTPVPGGYQATREIVRPVLRFGNGAPPSDLMASAVLIPRAQALTAGAFAAVAVGALAVVIPPLHDLWPSLALLAGSGVGGGWWAWATIDDNNLRWRIETALGVDLDGDGYKGAPPKTDIPETTETNITVNERQADGKIRRIITLNWPCKKEDIPAIAQRLLNGQLAQADWGKGTLLSVPKFKRVVASLIRAGYGAWNNPSDHTKGWHLTATGRVFLGEKPPNISDGQPAGRTEPPTYPTG